MQKAIEILGFYEHKTVGLKETLRLISENKAKAIVLAIDSDEEIKKQICKLCEQKTIEIVFASSKTELGKACKINVACAVVGLY